MEEKIVKPRKMPTADLMLFTGEAGEIIMDTDKHTLTMHDGTKAGGWPLALEDLSETLAVQLSEKGIALSDMSNVSQDALAARGVARTDMSNVNLESIAELGMLKADCSNGQPMTDSTQLGLVRFATLEETLADTLPNGASVKALSLSNALAMIQKKRGLPRDYLAGFDLSHTSDNEILIGPGSAKSSDDDVDIYFDGEISKTIDAAWEQGSGLGGLANGISCLPNSAYHAFIALRNSDGAIEVAFDSDAQGSNIAPMLAEFGFGKTRRVGSFHTDEDSNLIPDSLTSFAPSARNGRAWSSPMFSVCISKSWGTQYVADEDGWLYARCATTNWSWGVMSINGFDMPFNSGNGSQTTCMFVRISVGDVYTAFGATSGGLMFFPCKACQ